MKCKIIYTILSYLNLKIIRSCTFEKMKEEIELRKNQVENLRNRLNQYQFLNLTKGN